MKITDAMVARHTEALLGMWNAPIPEGVDMALVSRNALEAALSESDPIWSMSLAEASRQYQVALEFDRRLRAEFEDVMSADDVRLDSSLAVAEAKAELFVAWVNDR